MKKIVIGKKEEEQDLDSVQEKIASGPHSMVGVQDDTGKIVNGRILAQIENSKIKAKIDGVAGFKDTYVFLEIDGDNISLEYEETNENSREVARKLIEKLGLTYDLEVGAPVVSVPASTAPSTHTRASVQPTPPEAVEESLSISSGVLPSPSGPEESIVLEGSSMDRLSAELDRHGERLSADLDPDGERLSADLEDRGGPNRLNLGDRSYGNKGFAYMRTLAMASDEVTDDLNEMRITAFKDITPTGWENAKNAFIDTLTKLKSGKLVGMDNFLYKDEQRDYQVSYEKEGRAFYDAMEIPSKGQGNEMVLRGVDPETKRQYVTKIAYDPVERKVEHVFPRPKDTESEAFSPNKLQLLTTFEMLRETAKYSHDKSFKISGTKNTQLIIDCIQMGNSLGLKAIMSDAVRKHMLQEIAKDMDKFNERFGGTTPEEVLSSIEGSTYEGITPDGSPKRRLSEKRSL